MLIHNSNSIRQHSIRIIDTMAVIHGFNIWSKDVRQAYLQAYDGLKREVFVKAPEEFQVGPDTLLKLKKPLYGLTDSSDYCCHTLRRHLREDLKLKPSTVDLSLYTNKIAGGLSGITGSYVGDTLSAGNRDFEEESLITWRKFESSAHVHKDKTFSVMKIIPSDDGFWMSQDIYSKKLLAR